MILWSWRSCREEGHRIENVCLAIRFLAGIERPEKKQSEDVESSKEPGLSRNSNRRLRQDVYGRLVKQGTACWQFHRHESSLDLVGGGQ
jgi:hypothetical protein